VRYRVTGKVFVNGHLMDPRGKADIYVMAAPGLAGPSLELAPELSSAPSAAHTAAGAAISTAPLPGLPVGGNTGTT
jgi:hypothetical protein